MLFFLKSNWSTRMRIVTTGYNGNAWFETYLRLYFNLIMCTEWLRCCSNINFPHVCIWSLCIPANTIQSNVLPSYQNQFLWKLTLLYYSFLLTFTSINNNSWVEGLEFTTHFRSSLFWILSLTSVILKSHLFHSNRKYVVYQSYPLNNATQLDGWHRSVPHSLHFHIRYCMLFFKQVSQFCFDHQRHISLSSMMYKESHQC